MLTNPDTTVDIWDRSWRCLVSQNLTTSAEYYKIFGRQSSGYKAIDDSCPDQYVDTMITIDKMVEYHKKGIPIQVVNYDDCEKIYQCVERHLRAWANLLQHGVNIGDAPIDDLIAMDEFANSVYSKAKYIIKDEIATSVFMQRISSITTLSRNTFGSAITKNTDKVKREEDYAQRHEYSEVFKKNVIGFGRWK